VTWKERLGNLRASPRQILGAKLLETIRNHMKPAMGYVGIIYTTLSGSLVAPLAVNLHSGIYGERSIGRKIRTFKNV